MERIMVTVPAGLLGEMDAAAKELGESRSELIRRAVSDLLHRFRQRQFEELLAEGYREAARNSAAYVGDALPLQAAAAERSWVWDE